MKKLIAAAVAAAIVPASAIAGPTLYGKIHMAVGHYDNGGSGAAEYSDINVSSHSSRVGVKGDEDLGNGLKAVYHIEWGTQMDDSASSMSARDRYVGLAGGFGTVLMGYVNTPHKVVGRKVDLFTDRMGDTRANNKHADNGYVGNVVAYATPVMSGFQGWLAYSADALNNTDTDDQDNGTDSVTAAALYSNGPLFLGLGYLNVDNVQESVRLGASYKIGAGKIVGSYTNLNHDATDNDDKDWSLGYAHTFGSNTFNIQYSANDPEGRDNDSSTWALSLDHMMSKRTTAYVQFATTSNDAGAAITSWARTGVKAAGVADETNRGINVGLIHKF